MPSVFGRAAEQAAIVATLEDGLRAPAAAVLEGPPGIGKTTLWADAATAAEARGYTVLRARPAAVEQQLAYCGLADLLEPIVDDVSLPVPQRFALDIALMRTAPSGRLDQRAVAAGTLSLLRAVAGEAPVAVAIDDVQWLDGPTAGVLEFAVRRLVHERFALIVALRTAPGVRSPIRLERLLPPERVHQLAVGPLSAAVVRQVLAERLGRSFARRTLLRIIEASGGNPFYALEVARALPDTDDATALVVPVPDSLRELIDQRLSRLTRSAREALLFTAAAHTASLELIAVCLKTDPATVARDLARAVRAEIVKLDGSSVRFVHPLYAEAVAAFAGERELKRAHRRLAETTRDVEQRAWHRALAADGPDERIAGQLDRAADSARARGAPQTAAELAEQARALTPADRPAEHRRRTTVVAEYLLHAGEPTRSARLLEEVVETAVPGDERARALLLLGETRYQQDSFPQALELLERARSEVDDPHLLALILAQLGYLRMGLGDLASARSDLREAVARLDDRTAAFACALATSTMIDFMLADGADWLRLDRALELEDHDEPVPAATRPSVIAGLIHMYVGDVDEARTLLTDVRTRVVERGQESDLVLVAYHLAWLECWAGDLAAAAEHARETVDVAATIGGDAPMAAATALASVVRAYRGEDDDARALAATALGLSEKTGYLLPTLFALDALALLELAHGRPQAALAALEPLLPVAQAATHDPVVSWYATDLAEALVGVGRLDDAEALASGFEAAARRLDRAWAIAAALRVRALVLAARGELEGALATLDRALEHHARQSLPIERGRTFLVRGTVERRLKRKRDATGSLRAAEELFAATGAQPWRERAQEELGRIGLRPSARDELTSSERRVAELAASGLNNSEIAAAAFMSRKTVEANLTRVYRKLGIRSRAELGVRLSA